MNTRASITSETAPISARRTAEAFQPVAIPAAVKWSFVTRNVPHSAVSRVEMLDRHVPEAGDLILANVKKIAQHTRIQLHTGRRSLLYPGDRVLVAYGNRYAPDQFEALIPADLDVCHLVAAGGIAARAVSKNDRLKWPTSLTPEGYCLDSSGGVVNLRHFGLAPIRPVVGKQTPIIAVLGTSMNSGKTTAAASLVKGLTLAGHKVAAIKVTGTGAGNDLWAYADAGAALTLDFTDAGHPSTFKLSQPQVEACFLRLVNLAQNHCDVDLIVMEIADGLLQSETAALVTSEPFTRHVRRVVFTAAEAMGALAGAERLSALGITPIALSGLLSTSRLAAEEAERATGIPVLSKTTLETPRHAERVLSGH